MISGSKRQPSKSQSSSASSTAGRNSSRTKGSSTASSSNALQTKGKTQSQEDLTKGKEKTSTGRNKTGNGTSSATTRRLAASSKDSSSNRGAGDAKSRDKTAAFKTSTSSGGATTKTSSNLSNSKTSMTQSRKNLSRAKIESDRNAMESQIKLLETQSKAKDSEIKALKQKLDQMMILVEKNRQQLAGGGGDATHTSSDDGGGGGETAKFSSLVKLMGDGGDEDCSQLSQLQEENFKLKERIDMLILQSSSKKQQQKSSSDKHHNKAADDGSSNEEGLSSSMEDIDSAASVDLVIRSSTSVSRSTSTENLLDETNSAGSNPYLTLSGLSKMADNGGGACGSGGADDNSESEKVACLTVKIQQMEESHISTNEELEATVQELNDLQKSIPELTIDNDRLKREQNILMERLETSEKKLSEKQTESEHLRALVSDHLNDDGNHNDLKQQYVRLLNERRRLLEYQDSLSAELRRWEDERKESQEIMGDYLERLRISERDLKQANTDKIILEKKLKDTKESAEEENSQEIQRLRDELKSERQRIDDLLRMRDDGCESDDFVGIVDNLRREKQELEEKYMLLDDEYRDYQHENDKLDASVANLEEKLEATIAKAKKDSSELSELIDHLNDEIRLKDVKLEEANETIFIMEDSVEQQIAVQKHERHTIQQLQNQISNLKEERVRLMKEIQQSKKEQRNKTEEWKQFQIDMQMAVSIANDMRAETQAEVAKLREEKQILEDTVTKIRVENEQLRRKRVSSASMHSAAIYEAVNRRQGAATATAAAAAAAAAHTTAVDGPSAAAAVISLHESAHKSRRNAEPSPGVQSLIKSFDSQSGNTTGRSNSTSVSPVTTPVDQQPSTTSTNPAATNQSNSEQAANNSTFKIQTLKVGPSIATISPIQRHHSLSSISSPTSSTFATSSTSKLQGAAGGSSAGSSNSSKTGTPDSTRTGGSDLSQLSSYLRRNSTADSRKPPSSLDVNRSNSSVSEMLDHRMQQTQQQQQSTPTTTQTSTSSTGDKQRTKSASSAPSRGLANGNDPLVTLARKYGGSKRNALLQWCQKKTKDYAEIDITNFSTSWSDGLALCALMHSYLPAHIPYNSLVGAYASTNEERQRKLLQAKHFRLAFAAAESVGIEPTLSVDSMTLKERPDWQSVMYYVTQLYKYFET